MLWETRKEIVQSCELAITQALSELGLKKTLIINSEPPLVTRNVDISRLPSMEIRGMLWSLKPGKPFTKDQVIRLFQTVFNEK